MSFQGPWPLHSSIKWFDYLVCWLEAPWLPQSKPTESLRAGSSHHTKSCSLPWKRSTLLQFLQPPEWYFCPPLMQKDLHRVRSSNWRDFNLSQWGAFITSEWMVYSLLMVQKCSPCFEKEMKVSSFLVLAIHNRGIFWSVWMQSVSLHLSRSQQQMVPSTEEDISILNPER